MKYLALLIAAAKILEPIYNDFQAAVAEGKSTDDVTVKASKILQDAEDAIQKALSVL